MMSIILSNVAIIYFMIVGFLIYDIKNKKAIKANNSKIEKENDNKDFNKPSKEMIYVMKQMEVLEGKLSTLLEENDKIKKELNIKEKENEKLEKRIKESSYTEDDEKFMNEQLESIKDIRARIKAYKEIEENVPDEEPPVNEEELERLKFNNYMARMEMVKFRNSLSIENIERNMEIVVGRMVEQFFLANYYNNPAFMQSNGLYTPPFINEARRKIDMFAIYATFQRDVSTDFLEELALIYKYDVVSSEAFIVTNYIAPIYNRAMRKYKKAYKDYLYNESEHRLRLAESRKINPFWSSDYSEEQENMIKELNELYPIDEKKEAMREYLNDLKKRNGTLNR